MEGKAMVGVAVILVCVVGQALGQSWCQMLGGNCVPTGGCTGTVVNMNLLCSAGQLCCQPSVATPPTATPPTPTTTLPTIPPSTTAPVNTGSQTTPPPYGPWSLWSPCSSTCGEGLKQRARSCNHAQCLEAWEFETATCVSGPCPAWGVWSPWTACSVTCGGGLRQRRRACVIEGTSTPATNCQGSDTDYGNCATDVCPDPACGTADGLLARMFGSQLATRCEAPWVVHFQLTPDFPGAAPVTACSGVLIDRNSVLTTAMCAKLVQDFITVTGTPNPNNVRLTVGDFDTTLSTDGVVTGIRAFEYPSNYSQLNLRPFNSAADPVFTESDMAVVQLSTYLQPGTCKNFVCLPDSYRAINYTDCRVHSFGARGSLNGTVQPTNILQVANPYLGSEIFCDAVLGFSQPDYPGLDKFKENFFCASKRDAYNFCKGDEAAVLTCRDSKTMQWTAVGLGRLYPSVAAASFDPNACTSPNTAVIFAKIQPVLAWVRRVMTYN